MLQLIERLNDYSSRIYEGLRSVDKLELEKTLNLLEFAYKNKKHVYVCGNGGSLTMSEHFHCDHAKGINYDSQLHPKIEPLTTSSILTAIANDIGYDEVFSFQLNIKGDADDILIAISASGNSPNIIKALKKAKELNMLSIAFVGFDGGEAAQLADIVLHVKENNYGIIEDCHQSLMHIFAQHIRETNNKNAGIKL